MIISLTKVLVYRLAIRFSHLSQQLALLIAGVSEFGSLPMNLFAEREAVDRLHRDEMHNLVLADFIDVI
jgi:hypothetical protein